MTSFVTFFAKWTNYFWAFNQSVKISLLKLITESDVLGSDFKQMVR